MTQPCAQVFSVNGWFNNLQRAALLTSFWRQWFNNLQRTAYTLVVIGSIWQNSWSTAAAYGELCVWFLTNYRNGEIFWMNNKSHFTMPYKYGKCTRKLLGAFLFPFQSIFPRFWGVFDKTVIPLALVGDDYSQLGAKRLDGYLSFHIPRAPVE